MALVGLPDDPSECESQSPPSSGDVELTTAKPSSSESSQGDPPNSADNTIPVSTPAQQQIGVFMLMLFLVAYILHMVLQSALYHTQSRSCVDYAYFGQPPLGFKIGTIVLSWAVVAAFMIGVKNLNMMLWAQKAASHSDKLAPGTIKGAVPRCFVLFFSF